MTGLFVSSIRMRGGYRPPITVRAASKAEAVSLLKARYPGDAIEAVLPTRHWPAASDTGQHPGDIREHHG